MIVRTVVLSFQAVSQSGDIVRIPLHAVIADCTPAQMAGPDSIHSQAAVMQFQYQGLVYYCQLDQLEDSTRIQEAPEALE